MSVANRPLIGRIPRAFGVLPRTTGYHRSLPSIVCWLSATRPINGARAWSETRRGRHVGL